MECKSRSFKLTITLFCVLYSSVSAVAQMSFPDQIEIADRVTQNLQYVAVTAVPAPRISGLDPLAVFWIRDNETRSYTHMFANGEYTFGISDPSGQGVGPHLCNVVAETEYQLPRLEPRFLRDVRVDGEISIERGGVQVGVGVDGLEAMIREIFAATRYLGDWVLSREPARFFILIRGHADAGAGFVGTLLPAPYDFNQVPALAPSSQAPTSITLYERPEISFPVPNSYTNDHLPELRSRFLQRLVDSFTATCAQAAIGSYVLKGSVSSQIQASTRKADIFLYAYR
jgi:hypothetical protein